MPEIDVAQRYFVWFIQCHKGISTDWKYLKSRTFSLKKSRFLPSVEQSITTQDLQLVMTAISYI